MKTVKVCKDCGKYNNYKLYECAFCGANLDDDTIEVSDDEVEIKKVKEEIVQEESEKREEKEKENVCPVCGYSVNNSEWCDNCGNYLVKAEHDKEIKKGEIFFNLRYKENKYSFVATNEIKYIGRNDFSNIKDDNLISVSRKHIEYYYKDNSLYIKDVSSFGTYLNNEKMIIDKEYVVKNHSVIKFVYFEMEIDF